MTTKILRTLVIGILAPVAIAAQEPRTGRTFLVLALLAAQDARDRVAADIQKIERAIGKDDQVIAMNEQLLTKARAQHNAQVETIARDALATARKARQKDQDTRAALEVSRARAAVACAAIREQLASSLAHPAASPIQGMVHEYSGNVNIVRKNGTTTALGGGAPGFLEPGDEIATGGSSSATIQALDGRGTIRLGERSRVKIEEDSAERQALRLGEGKAYVVVDRPDDFGERMQNQLERYGDAVRTTNDAVEKALQEEFAAIKGGVRRWTRKFEVRSGPWAMAVRGTKFSVEITDGETTEITVFEGTVEASDAKGEKRVLVEAGFKSVVTKDGVSEPRPATDARKWWEK
jgi:hypothetical protein